MSFSAVQDRSARRDSVNEPPLAAAPDLAQLYASHFRYVWRCLRSLGVRDRELDDAIQDLFMVVQRKLPEFDGKVSPKTWLYAIAIRIARRTKERSWRDQRHASHGDDPESPCTSSPDAEAQVEQNQRLSLARAALSALDDDKREVFVLAQVEQMSAKEIADIVGIPMNTVYSRLRVARAAFEAEIQRLSLRSRSAS